MNDKRERESRKDAWIDVCELSEIKSSEIKENYWMIRVSYALMTLGE